MWNIRNKFNVVFLIYDLLTAVNFQSNVCLFTVGEPEVTLFSVAIVNIRYTIVTRGKWFWNSSKFFLLCFCSRLGLDPSQNAVVVYSLLRNQPITMCWLRNSVYERKTKDCAGSWTSQHKSWHLCLLLWCLLGFITSSLHQLWLYPDSYLVGSPSRCLRGLGEEKKRLDTRVDKRAGCHGKVRKVSRLFPY